MEVECPRHLGACTIGCQLLDENAPMAGHSWQASHEPPSWREEGHLWHWRNIYGGNKDGGRGVKKLTNYAWRLNGTTKNSREPRPCGRQKTAVCTGLPMLAQSMHWPRCTNDHSETQGNAGPWRMHRAWCLTKHRWSQGNANIGEGTGACAWQFRRPSREH